MHLNIASLKGRLLAQGFTEQEVEAMICKPTIFFITVMHFKEGDDSLKNPKRSRCWGWVRDFDEAEMLVKENATDMFEVGYYNMAVIEEMPEGLIPHAKQEIWYSATHIPGAETQMKPKVEKINKPEVFKSFIGWCF